MFSKKRVSCFPQQPESFGASAQNNTEIQSGLEPEFQGLLVRLPGNSEDSLGSPRAVETPVRGLLVEINRCNHWSHRLKVDSYIDFSGVASCSRQLTWKCTTPLSKRKVVFLQGSEFCALPC